MKITFLGTGSIIPSPKKEGKPYRSCSCIYVELNDGQTFFFDIGPGALTKAQQQGIDTRIQPDHLFITHYHIDHCQDYIAMVKGRSFSLETGKAEPGKRLHVYGPQDLQSWNQELFSKITRWNYMSTDLPYKTFTTLHELQTVDIVEGEGWNVSCIPVDHYDGVAYRLEAEGKSFVYSGDMGYDENLATLGKDADLVAVECSFPNNTGLLGKHLSPELVGKLTQLGGFKHTVLTHLYPQCEGKEAEMIQTVTSLANTKATIAEDFYTITL